MKHQHPNSSWTFLPIVALLAFIAVLSLLGHICAQEVKEEPKGKYTEELVYVKSEDDITNGGALFSPPKDSNKSIAIIWIHGWGTNFYYPSYVKIGRALAERGYTSITANTRMHDIGTSAAYRGGKRIRGGGYWGVASEEVRDLAAWIDFAASRGLKQVVLVGHSAGWAAVRGYQSVKQDPHVVGLVLASGGVRPNTTPPDQDLLAQASRLVAEGKGDDLLRIPNRPFPSFVSAATFLDIAKAPEEQTDFFGVKTQKPDITRIRCPLLAFFGTKGDVGTAEDLQLLKNCVQRQPSGPSRVDTVMIQNADHMYHGEEGQVAQTIARWADSLVSPQDGKSRVPEKR